MNKNSTTWVFRAISPVNMEMMQRVAFSFGYKWPLDTDVSTKPGQLDAPFLFVHPDRKLITFGRSEFTVQEDACLVVNTYSDALELFKNPPVKKVVVEQEKEKEKVEKLPWVSFSYRKKNGGEEFYSIIVVNQDENYLEGLDLNEGRQFKRFSIKNIIGSIVFLGFSEIRQ